MTLDSVDSVAVIGSGNMGHGIAEVAAIAGYEVTMQDVDADALAAGAEQVEWSLDKLCEAGRLDEPPAAVLDRLSTTVDLEAAVGDADLVVEAVPERLSLKRSVFAEVDAYAPDGAVLASNTSSLSITEIAAATDRPDWVVGTHFFNPPVKMDLVEVVYGERTSDETAETAFAFVESLGKTPIFVRKDIHRFVVNNVLGPFLDEPGWMVSEGVATIPQADAAMVHQRGYPMGPFELSDMTGIDVSYDVRRAADLDVPPIMESKVEAGAYGRKSGRGYYDYENDDGVDYEPGDGAGFDTLRVEACIVNEAARLVGDGIATATAVDTGMRLGTGFPEGPCRRADELGLDTVLEKLETLYDTYEAPRYRPSDYLVELVASGRTGRDAGAGFYEYDDSTDDGSDASA
jgi:enoyl-CoA hydratase/3-hydroxyacyl-CoA dehydrogenase